MFQPREKSRFLERFTMYSWDDTVTFIIVAAAVYYVALSIYKTIKDATKGCAGGCSACSHCTLKMPVIKETDYNKL